MKNWTVNATEALQRAQQKAYEKGHAEMEPLHLLWALVAEPGLATKVLRALEVDPGLVARTADQELASMPVVSRKEVPNPGRDLQRLMLEAQNEAQQRSGGMVGSRELLVALAADPGRAGAVMRTFDLNAAAVARGLEAAGAEGAYEGDDEADVAENQRVGAGEVRPRPGGRRARGQDRPGHRPRRGDPPRRADPLAPHQEQPRAHRLRRRGQDRRRRGPRAAPRRGRRAREPQGQAPATRSTWAPCSPARSTAASSRSA